MVRVLCGIIEKVLLAVIAVVTVVTVTTLIMVTTRIMLTRRRRAPA
ncbi:MAG: hypothetical protein OD918_02775 [Gammaproteobacteria bacterium]